ncbi:MAG: permease [Candidatus Aminicenantes bacterium]|nr:permease [Candidatus Aminicenantes bacterium]
MKPIKMMADKRKKSSMNMLVPTIIMGVIAAALLVYGWVNGQGQHVAGLRSAAMMTINVLPLLIFAFIIAGMIQTLLPAQLISRWVGAESGIKGILVGTLTGGFMPGGPYTSLPIAAGLLRAGAGVGTMVAFITAWSLWAVARLPMEIGILGWKFTSIRLICTFFFPPIAGLIANLFFPK